MKCHVLLPDQYNPSFTRPEGVLGQITTFVGSKGLNIEQQINTSRNEIAYTVLDLTTVDNPAQLQVSSADIKVT